MLLVSIHIYRVFEVRKNLEERWGEGEENPGAGIVSSIACFYTKFTFCVVRDIYVVF